MKKTFEAFVNELDPYGEENWSEENEIDDVRPQEWRPTPEWQERMDRIYREREENRRQEIADRRALVRQNTPKKLKGHGEKLKVGDRVWNREYGKGTVVHVYNKKDYFQEVYVNFDLTLPIDIMEDGEKNWATIHYNCHFGHGWCMRSRELYKIIEE